MSTNGVSNSGSTTLANWQSEASLAAELGGDVNAQVAAMMLKHGHEKRANAREMRHAEEDNLRSHEQQQVSKLREQAEQVLAAAKRAAYGKIASGGLQMTGAGVSILGGKKADPWSAGLKGAATGAEGGSELWAADATHEGKLAEIASTEADHRSAEAKRRMDDLRDEEQSAKEIIKSTFDFLKEASEAKAGIERALLASRA